jgi:hypothetical protein
MTTNSEQGSEASGEKTFAGGCHCGKVRFEATVELGAGGGRCNCSVCTKINPLAAIIKPEAFRLLTGESDLSAYAWGPKISTRFFCKHCGVHCFGKGHLAEVGGDFVSINLQTLDGVDPNTLTVTYWDGRHNNWQAGSRPTPWPILDASA